MKLLMLHRFFRSSVPRSCAPTFRSFSEDISPHTFVSFFLFQRLDSPEAVADSLREKLGECLFRGTIYVAPEGINGQFSIPSSKMTTFQDIVKNAHPTFSSIRFNVGDTYMEGGCLADILTFKRLSVKTRQYILTDGLDSDHDINWDDNGEELPAAAWHAEVESLRRCESSILLDCRNDYESDIGTFSNAIPLNTKTFSETFHVIESVLNDVPKDSRILTFCTGGIRCVKVNAYLRQKLGYKNVASLKDGIAGYKKWLDASSNASSCFRGDNYVFDRRRIQPMPSHSKESFSQNKK